MTDENIMIIAKTMAKGLLSNSRTANFKHKFPSNK